MKTFYFIFLAVGTLGEDSSSNVFKNLEQHLTNNNQDDLKVEESVPIDMDDGTIYRESGDQLDEKYISLFRQRFQDYRDTNYRFRIDDGNPDIHGRIIRPCQAYDTFCIRKFFAEHSRCKISGRAVPEPTLRAQLTSNYAQVNISVTQDNVEYRGISNARVEEFYINKATDNLVIALYFPSVTLFSNNSNLKFYLRGREPIVTRDFGGLDIPSFTATVVIPNLKDLKLEKAEITSYLNSPIQPYAVGPGLAATTDPEALLMLTAFLTDIQMDLQHETFTESNFYAATFIQYNICDFGLKVL